MQISRNAPALLSNTQGMALVDGDGAVTWLALPKASDAPLFQSDAPAPTRGGTFVVRAPEATRITRSFVGETAVLRTVWETSEGSASVLDFLPMRPGPNGWGKIPHHRMVRIVEGITGQTTFELRVAPVLDAPAEISFDPNGVLFSGASQTLILQTEQSVSQLGRELVARFSLNPGEKRHFVLTLVPEKDPDVPEMKTTEPDWDLDGTFDFWLAWAEEMAFQGVQRERILALASRVRAAWLAPEIYHSGDIDYPPPAFALAAPVALASWGWYEPFEHVLKSGSRLAKRDASVAGPFLDWLADAQGAGVLEAPHLPLHWEPWQEVAERLAASTVGPTPGLRGAAKIADDLLLAGNRILWEQKAEREPIRVEDEPYSRLTRAEAIAAIDAELTHGAYLQARRRMDRWLQEYDSLATEHDWLIAAYALAVAARIYLVAPPTPTRIEMPGDLGT